MLVKGLGQVTGMPTSPAGGARAPARYRVRSAAQQAEDDLACLAAEWDAARRAVADMSLDDIFVSDRWGEMSLRWAYLHMIGEYAQHNGHADLIRERIDGVTGR
ncbi:MAG: DUF664 domain-containing protein [Jiangellaceae bacterium]